MIEFDNCKYLSSGEILYSLETLLFFDVESNEDRETTTRLVTFPAINKIINSMFAFCDLVLE